MTRINTGVHPKHLMDKHLIAEHHEMLGLFGYIRNRPEVANIPPELSLRQPEHKDFFKNKVKYLIKRFHTIQAEMRDRGFKPKAVLDDGFVTAEMDHDWKPTKQAYKLISQRITDRIKEKSIDRYYRQSIDITGVLPHENKEISVI